MSCLSFVSRDNFALPRTVRAGPISISKVRRSRATYLAVMGRITGPTFSNTTTAHAHGRVPQYPSALRRTRRAVVVRYLNLVLSPTVLHTTSRSTDPQRWAELQIHFWLRRGIRNSHSTCARSPGLEREVHPALRTICFAAI